MEIIRFDWAIKTVLRDKANFGILEGFLSELLKQDITILELLESEANAEHEQDKLNRVDLVVKDEFGTLILIEIQNESQADYFHRMLYGASRLVTEHLNKGEAYGQIKKVITIHIVYFNLGQGEDYIYHGTTRFVGIHKHDELQLSEKQKDFLKLNDVYQIYPEYYILKVQAFQDVIAENFDEWMYILKHGEIQDSFKSKNMPLIEEKLNVIKMDQAERHRYKAYLEGLSYEKSMFDVNSQAKIQEGIQIGIEKGKEIGEVIGLEKGKLEEKFEMLLKLHAEGFDVTMMARLTGLGPEQIVIFLKEQGL